MTPRRLAPSLLWLWLIGHGGLAAAEPAARGYLWQRRQPGYEALAQRIAVPRGYRRVAVAPGSYEAWLRGLPLLRAGTSVRSYRGRTILPGRHPALAAVVDLDVGRRDRQQCVDTIMRLRGEYLFARGRADAARFAWAGGRRFGFAQWRRGLRPARKGRGWIFEARGPVSRGYPAFRSYLGYMFSWTGTIHQLGERRVKLARVRAGDFFLQAGSPGHAVLILDVATDAKAQRAVLLGQGYMPAQDLHVLSGSGPTSPWFRLAAGRALVTPLWPRPFAASDLRRFRD